MAEIVYRRVPTTYEAYHTILNIHASPKELRDLCVYESYTNIVENGICTIYTVWGLRSAEVALIGAETKYEAEDDKEVANTRTSQYWLCAPYLKDEDD